MPIPIKFIKIIPRKYYGYVQNGVAYVDERLKGKKRLEIILHEGLHVIFPYLTEATIESAAADLARLLWADGWRKIDNDESTPLQDESVH
jgi:hypothetical protein